MPTISIWFRSGDRKPEVVDRATNLRDAAYLAREYAMAFGVCIGMHRYGKSKVWFGRRDQEPDRDRS